MEYSQVRIKNLGDVVTGKTPATSNQKYYSGEYMFVTPNELHGEYRVDVSQKTVTQEGLNSVKTNSIDGISVMVGCIGWDMGNVAMCYKKCVTNQQINSITNIKEKCVPEYLYYWLSTKKEYLFSIASVTRTPILSKSTFEDIVVPLPNIEEQKKISQALLTLDEKIRLNKAINDNLQKMAYETYMHMFFGKSANGKLGDLIVENEKSTVQVGTAKDSTDNKYPFFTSGDAILRWNSSMVDGRNCYLNTGGNADVKFYVGSAAYSTDTWCITAANGFEDYLYLLLLSIKPELNQKFFQGTGLKHLQKPLLKDRPIYIPDETTIAEFNMSVQPWFDMIATNINENQRLISLRDWLLPMLMNGQATISD